MKKISSIVILLVALLNIVIATNESDSFSNSFDISNIEYVSEAETNCVACWIIAPVVIDKGFDFVTKILTGTDWTDYGTVKYGPNKGKTRYVCEDITFHSKNCVKGCADKFE